MFTIKSHRTAVCLESLVVSVNKFDQRRSNSTKLQQQSLCIRYPPPQREYSCLVFKLHDAVVVCKGTTLAKCRRFCRWLTSWWAVAYRNPVPPNLRNWKQSDFLSISWTSFNQLMQSLTSSTEIKSSNSDNSVKLLSIACKSTTKKKIEIRSRNFSQSNNN